MWILRHVTVDPMNLLQIMEIEDQVVLERGKGDRVVLEIGKGETLDIMEETRVLGEGMEGVVMEEGRDCIEEIIEGMGSLGIKTEIEVMKETLEEIVLNMMGIMN